MEEKITPAQAKISCLCFLISLDVSKQLLLLLLPQPQAATVPHQKWTEPPNTSQNNPSSLSHCLSRIREKPGTCPTQQWGTEAGEGENWRALQAKRKAAWAIQKAKWSVRMWSLMHTWPKAQEKMMGVGWEWWEGAIAGTRVCPCVNEWDSIHHTQ